MLLRTPTNNYPTYRKKHATISVNTIDGFQGQERDVIYISLVRSNTKNEIGFLSDYRRMNVAMTRARKLLVIIGDSSTIGNNKFYQALLEYCEKNGRYQTAWEYMR
jgi:superfamily I DNA and/or RNA helicase